MALNTLGQSLLNIFVRVTVVGLAVVLVAREITNAQFAGVVTVAFLFGALTTVVLAQYPVVQRTVAVVMGLALLTVGIGAAGADGALSAFLLVGALVAGLSAVGPAAPLILRLVPVVAVAVVTVTGVEPVRLVALALLTAGCLLLATILDRVAPHTARPGRLPEPRKLAAATGITAAAFALALLLVALLPAPPPASGGTGTVDDRVHPGFGGGLDVSGPIDLDEDLEVLRIESRWATYWRGTTYDTFDGQNWTSSGRAAPPVPDTAPTQTIEQRITNQAFPSWVIPAAAVPVELTGGSPALEATWWLDDDQTIRGDVPFLRGQTVDVVSALPVVDEAGLRASDPRTIPWRAPVTVTERVAELARSTTAGQPTVYDEIIALQAMIADRVEYTRDIEQLPRGVDAVEHLLFDSGRGFCEQIGTSLVAMATALDIPARLVVGFVPGDRDELRGEWIVRAGDAHAWVEVYFPGIGWQGFDPTAEVPLSADAEVESPWGAVLAIGAALAAVGLLLAAGMWLRRRRGRRARPWSATATDRLITVARDRGHEVDDAQTVIDIATGAGLADVGRVISEEHFGPGVDADRRTAVDTALAAAEAHAPRRGIRRRRRLRV